MNWERLAFGSAAVVFGSGVVAAITIAVVFVVRSAVTYWLGG